MANGQSGQKVDELFWELDAATAPLLSSLGVATTQLGKFSSFMTGAGGPIAVVGTLTAALGVMGAKGTAASARLDQNLREVNTILPETEAGIDQIRESVIALSTEVPDTPEQLTEGVYQAVSAGAEDASEALDIVEASSRAAVAGLTDTGTAVDAVTTVLNSYGLEAEEATRVTDVLFTTVEEGKVRFPELASQIGDVANTAALANVSIEEVGAALATLTARGLDAARSTTALNRMLLAVINPTDQMRDAADELGVELGAAALEADGLAGFIREVEKAVGASGAQMADAVKDAETLEQAEAKLQQQTGANVEALTRLFPNIRAARAAFVLAGEGADDFRQNLESQEEAQGAVQDAFDEMIGSVQNQFGILKDRLMVPLRELGQEILPGVTAALKAANDALGVLLDIPEGRVEELQKLIEEQLFQGTPGTPGGAQVMGVELLGLEGAGDESFRLAEGLSESQRKLGIVQENIRRVQEALADAEGDRANRLERALELLRKQRDQIRAAREETEDAEDAEEQRARNIERARDIAGDLAVEMAKVNERMARRLEQPLAQQREDAVGGLLEEGGMVPPGMERGEMPLDIEGAERSEEAIRRAKVELEEFITRQREAGVTGEQMALALTQKMDQLGLTVEDFNTQAMRDLLRALKNTDQDSQQAAASFGDVIDTARRGIQTITNFAQAFGLLGDGASRAVQALSGVAEGIKGIVQGGGNPLAIAQGALQAAGGLASAIGGLFGGGDDEAVEKARRENTEAVRELESSVDAMRDVFDQVSGDMLESVRSLVGESTTVGGFLRELEQSDLTRADLQSVADALGVSVDELTKLDDMDADVAAAELQGLQDAVEAIDLEQALSNFQGQMDLLKTELELFDVDDPVEELKRLRDTFVQFTDLPGRFQRRLEAVDLSTREGLEEAEQTIRDLFDAIASGEIQPGAFGELTLDQMLQQLEKMDQTMEEVRDEQGQTTAEFSVDRSVTEVTGSRIASQLDSVIVEEETQTGLLRSIRDLLSGQTPIRPPTQEEMDRAVPPGGGGSTSVTIQTLQLGPVEMNIEGGDTDPEALAEEILDELDQQLQERLRIVKRAGGERQLRIET